MQGIERLFAIPQKGFNEVIPQHFILHFDERELKLVVNWMAFKHCNRKTRVVGWLWKIVESSSEEMRVRLLEFVTGSSRVPSRGFKLCRCPRAAAGPRLPIIHVDAPTGLLPVVKT